MCRSISDAINPLIKGQGMILNRREIVERVAFKPSFPLFLKSKILKTAAVLRTAPFGGGRLSSRWSKDRDCFLRNSRPYGNDYN